MNIFRKFFKKKKQEKIMETETNKNKKKFMECETLEEFIAKYKMFHKQELALKDGRSYFNVETSNVDGHFFGECFDNAIRVKALNDNNPQFLAQIDEEELQAEILKEYKEDLEKSESEENNPNEE
jgi:hypothetical protein